MYADPSGYAIISSTLLTLGVAALVGAIVGVVGQFVGDLITSLFTGAMQFSSLEEYIGAAYGGAVGGLLSLIPGFGFGAAVIGSTLGTFAGYTLGKATGSNNMTWKEIVVQTSVSFGIGLATAGITKYARIPGITKGSHSFSQVWKSGVTKTLGYGASMSLKTAGKGIISIGVSEFGASFVASNFTQGLISAQFINAENYHNEYRKQLIPILP